MYGKKVSKSLCYVSFILILFTYFALAKSKDDKFGTGRYRGSFNKTADKKIRDALKDKKINLEYNLEDIESYVCYTMHRYFGIRGYSEVANLLWKQIKLTTMSDDDDLIFKGLRCVMIKISKDKGMFIILIFIFSFFIILTQFFFF